MGGGRGRGPLSFAPLPGTRISARHEGAAVCQQQPWHAPPACHRVLPSHTRYALMHTRAGHVQPGGLVQAREQPGARRGGPEQKGAQDGERSAAELRQGPGAVERDAAGGGPGRVLQVAAVVGLLPDVALFRDGAVAAFCEAQTCVQGWTPRVMRADVWSMTALLWSSGTNLRVAPASAPRCERGHRQSKALLRHPCGHSMISASWG